VFDAYPLAAMGITSDTIKRPVDARDMTEMSDISDRVPSPVDRKICLSGDYKEEQLRAAFPGFE
jgi:hypothetical protein